MQTRLFQHPPGFAIARHCGTAASAFARTLPGLRDSLMPVIEASIPAVLRERVSLQPNDAAFTYIDYEHDWDGVAETLTWSQLYRRTLNLAEQIRLCGTTGDRAVILRRKDLITSSVFWAHCRPDLPPFRFRSRLVGPTMSSSISVLSDASPAAILTTSAVVDLVAEYVKRSPTDPRHRSSKLICWSSIPGKHRPWVRLSRRW